MPRIKATCHICKQIVRKIALERRIRHRAGEVTVCEKCERKEVKKLFEGRRPCDLCNEEYYLMNHVYLSHAGNDIALLCLSCYKQLDDYTEPLLFRTKQIWPAEDTFRASLSAAVGPYEFALLMLNQFQWGAFHMVEWCRSLWKRFIALWRPCHE